MKIRGWVYIIENDAMPELIKIGYSTKDPALRAKELDNTGSPHSYRVVYDALVWNPRSVEKQLHEKMQDRRVGKEWFKCSADSACDLIRQVADEILFEQLSPDLAEKNAVAGTISKVLCTRCGSEADRNYKGVNYCEFHYEELRKERFNRVRKSIQGSSTAGA